METLDLIITRQTDDDELILFPEELKTDDDGLILFPKEWKTDSVVLFL